MWFFSSKKSLRKQGFFKGFTDYHCHVLPGVDDGFSAMEDALKALKRYEELGVKAIWLTPHIMEDIRNTPAELRARFEELKNAYKGSVELNLAAEYMLDGNFSQILESGDLLPIIDDRHLLVEVSYLVQQNSIFSILDKIKKHGYTPILAHPERYLYLVDSDFLHLSQLGVELQMNLPSIAGYYGEDVKNRALHLLKRKVFSYYGTDLHRFHMLRKIADIKTKENIL